MSEPSTQSTALAVLDELAERAARLRNDLRDGIAADGKSLDPESTIAVYSVAVAACASLSSANIASLTEAIRKKQLPRRKGA